MPGATTLPKKTYQVVFELVIEATDEEEAVDAARHVVGDGWERSLTVRELYERKKLT